MEGKRKEENLGNRQDNKSTFINRRDMEDEN